MSTAQMHDVRTSAASDSSEVQFRLEVVVVPVADYDRARAFFTSLGWRVDADVDGGGGYRLMQLTPPGSAASVIFGTQVTGAQPGSLDGLLLAVDDIEAARSALMARGVSVSEAFHDVNGGLGGGFHIGDEGRAAGPDPERRSYATYASFHDSEGNRWLLQELTTRLPGRVDEDGAAVEAVARLLRETSEHHDPYEKAAAKHDWWDWYAAYFVSRQHGSTSAEATRQAGRHMAEHKGITVT